MVVAGTPAAVGMQGIFPDPLSDEFAAALYDYLLAGQDLAEALRQARLAVSKMPGALGLPVGYVAAAGGDISTQRRGDAEAPGDGALRFVLAPVQPVGEALRAGAGHAALPA